MHFKYLEDNILKLVNYFQNTERTWYKQAQALQVSIIKTFEDWENTNKNEIDVLAANIGLYRDKYRQLYDRLYGLEINWVSHMKLYNTNLFKC